MDMSGMNSNASAMSNSSTTSHSPMMLSYLHLKVDGYAGDYVLFSAWRPSTSGQIAGAAIGLLFFAILERLLGTVRACLTARWQELDNASSHDDHSVDEKGGNSQPPAKRTIPAFKLKHDLLRGFLYSIHAVFGYVLMLNVMTFQGAYIIAICAGLGIGEMLFGRMGSMGAH